MDRDKNREEELAEEDTYQVSENIDLDGEYWSLTIGRVSRDEVIEEFGAVTKKYIMWLMMKKFSHKFSPRLADNGWFKCPLCALKRLAVRIIKWMECNE